MFGLASVISPGVKIDSGAKTTEATPTSVETMGVLVAAHSTIA